MDTVEDKSSRPLAYEKYSYPWNIKRVPKTILIENKSLPHPGRHCAVFVVHGMGNQKSTDTAMILRSGFEDALEKIRKWQKRHLKPAEVTKGEVPPPVVFEGFWADYDDLLETFPEDWKIFSQHERCFFSHLFQKRVHSTWGTIFWFLYQQLRLLTKKPFISLAWWVYLPLQIIFPVALIVALIRSYRIISNVLSDVRVYASPKGICEKAMVQRIEYRIGCKFLKLIGLDWNFKPLPHRIQGNVAGVPYAFNRVVWVSHSLGTVISYNVLSDLFYRAYEIEKNGTKQQQVGVKKFKTTLRRFVTFGSPLDKFAALFPETLRPWYSEYAESTKPSEPNESINQQIDRTKLLPDTGDILKETTTSIKIEPTNKREWWINFYNVLDPVSGALNNRKICGDVAPVNIHSLSGLTAVIPGIAHISYWSAVKMLRYILGRTYGKIYLQDKNIKATSAIIRTLLAIVGDLVWIVLMFGTLGIFSLCIYFITTGSWEKAWNILRWIF
jgi:hypothetical protein